MTEVASVKELTTFLASQPATDEVLFEAEGDAVGLGYHLTELRMARISSIDCGGVEDAWDEAQMQVLDAPGDEAMSAGKMAAILKRSAEAVHGLAKAPLNVEFSRGNQGLGRYRLGVPRVSEGVVTLPLTRMGPECKAMSRAFDKPEASGCCKQPTTRAGCC